MWQEYIEYYVMCEDLTVVYLGGNLFLGAFSQTTDGEGVHMQKNEMRKVAVNYCDGCGKESSHLERCGVCKEEFCMQEGGKFHFAYSVEVYRYGDGTRSISHICYNCSTATFVLPLNLILDGVVGDKPMKS